MWKALLKKQFMELVAFYFPRRKPGKKRSGGSLVLFGILLVFVLLSLGASFFAAADMLAAAMLPAGLSWLYFALMGILAVLIGVLGGVFSTYAGLYLAKDNDLLLSLPIPPRRILLVRMIAIYAAGLVYSGVAWVPAVIRYLLFDASPAALVFSLLLTFVNALLVLVLSCLLGWVVAAIASRLRNKNIISVILALLFLGVYFYSTSRMNQLMSALTENAGSLGTVVREKLWPLWQMGMAASGQAVPMVIWCCLVLALFLLTYALLSRSFLRLATANRGMRKKVYRAGRSKASTVDAALLRKELKRFTGSPVYMMNCGMGLIILVVLAVGILVKASALREGIGLFFAAAPPVLPLLLPAAGAMVVSLVCGMAPITAPSVSLEGKSLWVLQSLPVPAGAVLRAKERLHLLLVLPPAVLCCLALAFALGVDLLSGLLMVLIVALFTAVTGALGLTANLKKPNLTWVSEVVPVKQGLPVLISMFGGAALAFLSMGLCALVGIHSDIRLGMAAEAVLLAAVLLLLKRWLKNKGCAIFESL